MALTDGDGLDYESALFDVDHDPRLVPVVKQKQSRTAAEHRKVARRIGAGVHPLGEPIRLHADAPRDLDWAEAKRSMSDGPRCGSCVFRVQARWPKCHLPTRVGDRDTYPRDTGSDTSDIAAWWPACTSYKKQEKR
jgi:hypothetical protein